MPASHAASSQTGTGGRLRGTPDALRTRGPDHPSYGEDLFSPEALRDPFDHYRAIRELGPVVWLERTGVFALGRFAGVQTALRSPETLISREGVGFNALFNAPAPHLPVIRRDGDDHRRLRRVLARPLMPAALKVHRAMLKRLIATRIDALVGCGEFDAVTKIAQLLPIEAIAHLVGLSDADRGKMLSWATASFNAIGPLALDGTDPPNLISDIETQVDVRRYLLEIDPHSVQPGTWAASLFEAVERGELELQDARAALSGLVLPSLDTTINAKGNLLYNLATHPEEWEALRKNPALIGSAVQESMRFSPVVRWFSRIAVNDYADSEIFVPKGGRVMLLYGSANRDPDHYPEPDRFRIARNPTDQLGWGTGPHICAGASLARLEMEVMLEALVERVTRLEAGEAVPGANRGLYGFERLSLRLD